MLPAVLTTLCSSFVLTSAATRSWARWVDLNSNWLDLDYSSIQMEVRFLLFLLYARCIRHLTNDAISKRFIAVKIKLTFVVNN